MENSEMMLEKHYNIPYELFGEAFVTFQKRYVFPRNRFLSALLLAAAVANTIYTVLGYGSTFSYVLIMLCLALVFVNWYNPRKLRKNLMTAIKGIENDEYVLKLYPEKLVIGTIFQAEEKEEESSEKDDYNGVFGENKPQPEINESEIFLNQNTKIYEKLDFFIVYIQKAMFYVVPKEAFSEEENMILRVHFEKQLGKNFKKDKQIA